MSSEYDQITAFHYAAYRPYLHFLILKECLKNKTKLPLGLDVGCGTGQSSIALVNFCNKVIGIDPSKEMLQKSILHPNIEYSFYNKKAFNFSDDFFDIVTFAGSLYYAKSQELLNEVIRVTKKASKIIVYDFEISLDSILEKLHLETTSKPELLYDHQVNFESLDATDIKIEQKYKKHLPIEISITNLSHLLLSSKDNYSLLFSSLRKENLYSKVSQKLNEIYKKENISVDAITYMAVYKNVK